jgi:hypothetical protein
LKPSFTETSFSWAASEQKATQKPTEREDEDEEILVGLAAQAYADYGGNTRYIDSDMQM